MANTATALKVYIFNFAGDDYITIQNFSDVTTGASPGYGVHIATCTSTSTNIIFDNNNFSGDFQSGFYALVGADSWVIKNNIIEQTSVVSTAYATNFSGDAIQIRDTNDFKVLNNRISNWGHAGPGCSNVTAGYTCENVEVAYNLVSSPDNDTYGVGAGAGAVSPGVTQDVYIHHNMFDGNRKRSDLNGAIRIYIYGNVYKNIENCCDDLGGVDTGCSAAATTDTCSNFYSYYKTGYGIFMQQSSDDIYIWNNTFYKIAEACIFFKTSGGVNDNINIFNNVMYQCAMYSDVNTSPVGSTEEGQDYAISYRNADGNPPTNIAIENNIVDTNAGSTDANGDTEWGGVVRTISAFNTAYAWASGNFDQDPSFKSATQLWPDDAGDPMVGGGKTISGLPYTGAPKYNEVVDPDNTTWDTDPPVVATVVQPASWYIGAYAQEGTPGSSTSNINGMQPNGMEIN